MKRYGYSTKKSITDKVKKYFPNSYQEKIKEAKKNRKGYEYKLTKIKNNFDAYFVGLLMTDGYVTTRGIDVGIDLTDEDCIKFLSCSIGKNYKVYQNKNNNKNIFRLVLTDKELVNNVKRFGIVQNKSLILQPPFLEPEEEKFLPYIIRGIIDGDGCVSPTSYGSPQFYIVSMSEPFIEWIKQVLENKLFLVDIHKRQCSSGIWKIETSNQFNIFKLISLVYDKPFGMTRKYEEIRKTFRDYNSITLLEE